jgi:tRNA (guanine37-N1)-methyltransferase
MKIDILTLFPKMFDTLNESIIGKAIERGKVQVETHDFREFTLNKHLKVDDTPYGGGHGMVISVEPVDRCMQSLDRTEKTKVILVSPQGTPLSHKKAVELSKEEHLVFLCGHYEGFDERVHKMFVDEEISIGDYVLTGGELAAMVIIDATVRLLPDVLGNEMSHLDDSFANVLLDHDHYTRPASYAGHDVPEVLLSGNHGKIEEWRNNSKITNTKEKRPDIYEKWVNDRKVNNGE